MLTVRERIGSTRFTELQSQLAPRYQGSWDLEIRRNTSKQAPEQLQSVTKTPQLPHPSSHRANDAVRRAEATIVSVKPRTSSGDIMSREIALFDRDSRPCILRLYQARIKLLCHTRGMVTSASVSAPLRNPSLCLLITLSRRSGSMVPNQTSDGTDSDRESLA